MRIRVEHEIRCRFDAPVKSLVRLLRLTPRNHEGQHVSSWRVDVDVDCRLPASEDVFGNLVHVLNCDGPVEAFSLQVLRDSAIRVVEVAAGDRYEFYK